MLQVFLFVNTKYILIFTKFDIIKYMKKNLRWYDKDKYLSAFMTLLQELPDDIQSKVAVDILLYIPKVIEKDFTKFIKIVADHNPRQYQRWYDHNPNLHTAVESIRELSSEEREKLLNSISDIIIKHTNQNPFEFGK